MGKALKLEIGQKFNKLTYLGGRYKEKQQSLCSMSMRMWNNKVYRTKLSD